MLVGSFIDVSDVHSENAFSPICFTLSGMLMEVKPAQPENAPSSMTVTLFGILKSPFFVRGQHLSVVKSLV